MMAKLRISDENDTRLMIKSSEANGDSWAFLFLFTGITVWFVIEAYSGKGFVLLPVAVVTLIVAYAYLVEVVNTNYLVLDDEQLMTFSTPLPWISKPVVLPVEAIEYFVADELVVSTSQGDALQYAVSMGLVEQEQECLLFYTRDLAEAEAVAKLGNEKLALLTAAEE